MAERAAHLLDRVFPDVPVRQWVLSLPYRMRYQLAWNHDVCRGVVAVFLRAVLGRLRLIALIEEEGVIEQILRHLGVPTEIPAPRPARAPPLRVKTPNQAGWDDDPSVFDPCSRRS